MKFENLDVMFKGDIVKEGETYLLVTETRFIDFSGIDLSDGVEKDYLYGDIEVIAIGERGFKEQIKRYREALKNIYELAEYDEYDNTLEQIISEVEKAFEGHE